MSFQEALLRCAEEINTLLERLLPLIATPATRLVEAMRYAVLGEGKRIRPLLVVESAALFDVPRERALRVGAALECVHCYSLVHDDLPAMDNDNFRRGKPATHRAFDEATAILAGDALLSLAFEILADAATHPDANVRIALVANLANASGMMGMIGGQMLDISGGDIVQTQKLKTGALFRFACEAGAILAGADAAALRQYADNIGLAYQIADDILDVDSTTAELDKARLEQLTAAGIAALDAYGPRAETLRQAARF
ncbi:MAG TPA: polyprenyl synthetase family protein, partial [Aestuariivirga sp.]|nr:polyprenyl synthetase family protein [Aestuariivirga sp.]